jgi:hypothetical protein
VVLRTLTSGSAIHADEPVIETLVVLGLGMLSSGLAHVLVTGARGFAGLALALSSAAAGPDIYQLTKLEGEKMAVESADLTRVPLTVVRPGLIYGLGDKRLLKPIGGVARGRLTPLGDDSDLGFTLKVRLGGGIRRTLDFYRQFGWV